MILVDNKVLRCPCCDSTYIIMLKPIIDENGKNVEIADMQCKSCGTYWTKDFIEKYLRGEVKVMKLNREFSYFRRFVKKT